MVSGQGSVVPTDDTFERPVKIQPGTPIWGGTLAFLFHSHNQTNDDGEPIIFALTHAHGVLGGGVGQPVVLAEDARTIGVIVAQERDLYNDWSLVRIHEHERTNVDFAVRGWSGPTGPAVPDEVQAGDVVCLVGHGIDYRDREDAEFRCGQLQSTTTESNVSGFRYTALTAGGDSGSPVIHYGTGQALGMHLGSYLHAEQARAIDLCSVLERAAANGYDLELATAAYAPPPAKPAVSAVWDEPLGAPCLGGR